MNGREWLATLIGGWRAEHEAESHEARVEEYRRAFEYAQSQDWDWTDDELAEQYVRNLESVASLEVKP